MIQIKELNARITNMDSSLSTIKTNVDTFIKIDKARRDNSFTSELAPDQNNDNSFKMKIQS